MNVPTFEYTAASGKKFKAVTLRALLEASGLKADGARAIYGARGTEHQGVALVLLEPIDVKQDRTEQTLGEDAVLALLHKVLRGKTSPADAARALATGGQKRGRPRKTG